MNWRNDLTKEVVVPSAEIIAGEMARVLEDPNPLHRDQAVAEKYTFPMPPAMGVFPMIHGEEQLLLAVQDRNGDNLKEVTFALNSPCYPGDKLRFEFGPENTGKIYRMGANKSGGDFQAASIKRINLGEGFEIFDQASAGKVHHQKKYTIDRKRLDDITQCLGCARMETPSAMVLASTLPAALVDFCAKKGKIDGGYQQASFRMFAKPELGEVEARLSLKSYNCRGEKVHVYTVQGICYQSGKPILEGNLIVFSRSKFEV